MSNINARIDEDDDRERLRDIAKPVGVLVGLALLAWGGFSFYGDDTVSVRRPPPNTQVDLLPPPPPPPPPDVEEPPPDKIEEVTPDETPAPSPDPAPEAPAPMSIDAPATAGSDSFGMRAGSGGGMGAPSSIGSCIGPDCGKGSGGFNDRFYRTYLSSALQTALRRDKSINRDRFSVTVLIWVDASGKVSRAEIVDGSGARSLDTRILAALRNISELRPPQEGVQFPQRALVRGTARGS